MEYSENKPIYLQITDRIMDDILRDIYPLEGRLPSVREYAASSEVNPNTVMRSFDWLQQHNIIFNKRGIGFFVVPEAKERIVDMRKEEFFNGEADFFFGRLKSLGISPENLSELYRRFLKENE
ncbi:MAG: GntR family transcriptional regulator [Muribaculaceae bacterium]|nr:GntR family transcriptional regulator [Muribaculaceae bacterium]MDE7109569.1 GntR family transcriptional regulator [Muribaculaceae bacterium]